MKETDQGLKLEMKNKNQQEEAHCIKVFVKEYSKLKKTHFQITDWPDQNKPGDIDAIAKDRNEVLAIEHTSIDSYKKQREDDAVFNKVFGRIGNELRNSFKGRTTFIVPVKAIRRKKDQERVYKILKIWLGNNVPGLAYGKHSISISELDFEITIWKEESDRNFFCVARSDPEDKNFNQSFKDLVEKKSQKLIPYQDENTTRILLVENEDIALMSPAKMREAWKNAVREGVKNFANQIWYVDSSIKSQYWLHLLFSEEILPMEKECILASSSPN